MDLHSNPIHEMSLLEQIESDPDVTQASLATRLGVAVGTVNWHLKRLITKGYVKIKRAERKRLRYIITPDGIALRTRLTVDYIEQQLLLYRRLRQRVKEAQHMHFFAGLGLQAWQHHQPAPGRGLLHGGHIGAGIVLA